MNRALKNANFPGLQRMSDVSVMGQQGNPSASAANPQPDQPPEPLTKDSGWDELEPKLWSIFKRMYENAKWINQGRRAKFADYRRRLDSLRSLDSDGSGLPERGFYLSRISQLIRSMIALIAPEVIPDASTMDFVEARALYPGFEEYAQKVAAMMQANARRMQPEECPQGGLAELNIAFLIDFLGLGLCASIVGYKYKQDAMDKVSNDCAMPEYLDPANLNPGYLDTHDPDYFGIYTQISESDALRMQIPDSIKERLVANMSRNDPKRDPDQQWNYGTAGDDYGLNDTGTLGWDITGTVAGGRLVMRWPEDQFRNAGLRAEDGWTKEKIIGVIAEGMEWEPTELEEALAAEWWNVLFDRKNVIIKLEPWPTPLPDGYCPIRWSGLFMRNGRFWPHGLYDAGVGQEKLLNFFYNAECKITALAAEPPYSFQTEYVDKKLLAEWGNRLPPLTGGMAVQTVGLPPGTDPFHFFVPGIEFLSAVSSRRVSCDDELREQTHGSRVIEGQQQSKTATEDANKTQQGLAWQKQITEQYRRTFIEPIMKICYVIKSEALRSTGTTQTFPSSAAEQQLRTIEIRPEEIAGLDVIDIYCCAGDAPGGRQARIQSLERYAQIGIPMGGDNLMEFKKEYAKAIDLPGRERIQEGYSQHELQEILMNFMRMYGPEWMGAMQQLVPPAVLQQIMQLVGMGPVNPALAQQSGAGAGGLQMPPSAAQQRQQLTAGGQAGSGNSNPPSNAGVPRPGAAQPVAAGSQAPLQAQAA